MREVMLGVLVAALLVFAIWKAAPPDPCGYLRQHPPSDPRAARLVRCADCWEQQTNPQTGDLESILRVNGSKANRYCSSAPCNILVQQPC